MIYIEEIQFTLEESEPLNRGAYRIKVRGLQARIEDDNTLHDVYDVSAMGCGMLAPQSSYEIGRILSISLEARRTPLVSGLRARVVRYVGQDIVACCFQESTLAQEYALDKLVLEIQKRQIARIKTGPLLRTGG